MKALFIGGTGTISTDVVALAQQKVGDYSPKSWFEKDAGGNSQYHCGY